MRLPQILILLTLMIIVSCNDENEETKPPEMNQAEINVPVETIGSINGVDVKAYTISNNNNLSMTVLNYGGIVQSLLVPDREGKMGNVVLGYEKPEGYLQEGNPYFGALIGRYANRIANGKFSIGDKEYKLTVNNDPNTLHSGEHGFHNDFWIVEPLSNSSLLLKYTSADGQEGFPGKLTVEVIYILTDNNEWIIDYTARTDKATPVNLTQHTYFNLNAFQNAADVLNHEVYFNVTHYTPVNEYLIPTGEIATVKSTPFDFSEPKVLGTVIGALKGGFDHNLIFQKERAMDKPVAIIKDASSGRKVTMYTTEPAVQFFTGGVLDGSLIHTHHQRNYPQFAGFCLEAQHYPNSPNQSNFPDVILRPGETYFQKTIYRFGIE